MKKILSTLSLIVFVVLSGCATVDPKAIQASAAGKSIAVVSKGCDTVQLDWLGTLVFGNEFGVREVPDWRFDEELAEKTVVMLQHSSRYGQVVALNGMNRTAEDLRRAAIDKGADIIVLIEKGTYPDPTILRTSLNVTGIGIYQRTVLDRSKTFGFASFNISVIDAHSGRLIGKSGKAGYWASSIKFQPGPSISEEDLQDFRHVASIMAPGTVDAILEQLGML